jgi:hypothetical protein
MRVKDLLPGRETLASLVDGPRPEELVIRTMAAEYRFSITSQGIRFVDHPVHGNARVRLGAQSTEQWLGWNTDAKLRAPRVGEHLFVRLLDDAGLSDPWFATTRVEAVERRQLGEVVMH